LAKAQAASFEKQATREERMELWGAAALSWSRVAEGRPDDASAHRRAAFCLWRSNGDLKRARDLALRAIELSSGDIEARITLGRIYLGAGMKLNARREIEAAAKLDPKDEIVKNLLRELKT
jgi:Flp pilus assembly protein TadD